MSRVEEALSIYHERHHTLIPIHVDHSWALMALADEYAKLRDPTPITEEWAAKVRSERVDLYEGAVSGWWHCQIIVPSPGGNLTLYFPCQHEGQIRCLLLAAGSECDA